MRLQKDTCRPNHGLQTAYEFGEDIGGMERSRYFGYSKDLYHFDHFMGMIAAACQNYSLEIRCRLCLLSLIPESLVTVAVASKC